MKIGLLISVIVLTFVLGGVCGCSGKTDASNAADVSGVWKGNVDVTDTDLFTKKVSKKSAPIELILAQTGKNIAGKVTFMGGSATINSGFIVDKTLSLEAGILNIDAISDGKSIEGTIKAEFRGNYGEGSVHRLTGTFKVTK
jgi:hypothetical protein